MMFGSEGGAGPAEHPGRAASTGEDHQQQKPVPFSGGRKPSSPSILSQSARSEDTTSGSMTTRTVTLAQAISEAPSEAQTRAHTPARIPIPSPPPQSSLHPPGDLSTALTSFVTAPPTIVSRTTDSGDDECTLEMWNEGAEHYAPPHTRGILPH